MDVLFTVPRPIIDGPLHVEHDHNGVGCLYGYSGYQATLVKRPRASLVGKLL